MITKKVELGLFKSAVPNLNVDHVKSFKARAITMTRII